MITVWRSKGSLKTGSKVTLMLLTFGMLETTLVTKTYKITFVNIDILMIQRDLFVTGNVFKKLKNG